MKKIILVAVLLVLCVTFAQTEEKAVDKYGFNIIFGGGFNMMKSWENYPEEDLEEIPGAGLVGMKLEYDIGQFFEFPEFCVFGGSDAAITQIGKFGIYDGLGYQTGFYEFSHTTFISEIGLLKKFTAAENFLLYLGGSFVFENMDVEAKPDLELDGPWSSNGFRGIGGLNYRLGNAWFFDLQMSYTGMNPIENDSGDEIEFDFPGNTDDTEFLVPSGFSLKIGLGLRI